MKKTLIIKGQTFSLTADETMEKFKGLCEKLSGKYFIDSYDREDLRQVCYVELFKAYVKYDATVGVDFLNYSYQIITNELKRLLRDSKTTKRNTDNIGFVDIDGKVGSSGEAHTFCEVIADETVNVEQEVETSELVKIIKQVITEDEEILLPVMMGLRTAKSVADEINMSAEGVRKKILRLKAKLRKSLNVEETL